MDLGIAGRNAIVCASSRGLGFACANALAREGVNVVINSRNAEVLALAASTLRSDRKSTRLNSSHVSESRMPSSA